MSLAFILSTPLSVPSRRGARAPRRGATARLAQLPKSANVRKERLEKVKQISQTVLEQDSIESTPFQRNLLYVFVGLTTYEASHIICSISSAYQAVQCVFSMVASYIVCDFAVAFYHHAVDNYGNGDTPIFGNQIAAFQGHHTYPYTITARTPANNVHKSISALLPIQVIVSSLAMWPPLSAFLCSFVAFSVLAQETHRQAHMARYVAPWIGHLQNCGLIISSRAHALHHKKGGNYATHYGILSGWANQVLDNGILRLWEAVLYTTFGATPQCWLLDETLKTQAMETLPAWWPKSNK